MKTLGFISLFLLFAVHVLKSQTDSPTPVLMIQLPKKMLRADSLLQQISYQSGLRFSFSSKLIQGAERIVLQDKRLTVKECLDAIKHHFRLDYKRIGNHVVFSEKRIEETPSKRKKSVVDYEVTRLRSRDRTDRLQAKSLPPFSIHKLLDKTLNTFDKLEVDSKPVFVAPASIPGSSTPSLQLMRPKSFSSQDRLQAPPKQTDGSRETDGIFGHAMPLRMSVGLYGSDAFFVNSSFEVGLSWIYGILSWGTNFKVSGPRFGGGISANVNKQMKFNAEFVTGSFSKGFMIDSIRTLQARDRLNSLNLLVTRNLGRKLFLKAGLSVQFLSVRYFLDGQAHQFSDPRKESEKQYYLLSPPYFLSNSYTSGSVANLKTWVGAYAGIFYSIW